jgi:hypothetical protein
MADRRKPRVKIGRRHSDIPVAVIEQFRGDIQGIRTTLDNHLSDHNEMVKTLVSINENIKRSNEFMANLSWLNDISMGTRLLKSPMLWLLALIVGLIALMGGVKALSAGFISWVIPK